MKRCKLFIVDDHPIMRETLDLLLRQNGNIFITGMAENGMQAVDMIKLNQANIDIVLMDLEMPFMDGIRATRIIRESCPHIKVLVLTTHDDLSMLSKAIEAGAMGFAIKPVAKTQLLEAISSISAGYSYFGTNRYSIKMGSDHA
jgi:DNA-binding NarL/FixJ family response regulator